MPAWRPHQSAGLLRVDTACTLQGDNRLLRCAQPLTPPLAPSAGATVCLLTNRNGKARSRRAAASVPELHAGSPSC